MKYAITTLLFAASALSYADTPAPAAPPTQEWLNQHANDPLPPLHAAAQAGNAEECRRLIAEGANVNAPSLPSPTEGEQGFGETPLMIAAEKGCDDVCRILLEAGADPNTTTLYELTTPLLLAARHGHASTCRLLLAHGADPDAGTRTISTPLMLAALYGHTEVCRLLFAAEVQDTEMTDRWGDTALALAIRGIPDTPACRSTLQVLLNAGVDPNSGLPAAIATNDLESCRALLAAGADPTAPSDDDDTTPLELAQAAGHTAIVELLSAHKPSPATDEEEEEELLSYAQMAEVLCGESTRLQLVFSHPAEGINYNFTGGEPRTRRHSPCSTFKIAAALLALEHGVLDPHHSVKKWNGQTYARDEWNRDMDFESAFRSSCVWYFRSLVDDLAAKLGPDALSAALAKLGYGNADISDFAGKLNTYTADPTLMGFWLNSSLLISPAEQVQLMQHIFGEDSPYSPTTLDTLKRAMLVSDSRPGIRIYGKTGTGGIGSRLTDGWFVGFADTPEGPIYFCVHLQNPAGSPGVSGLQAKQILFAALRDYLPEGLYDESADTSDVSADVDASPAAQETPAPDTSLPPLHAAAAAGDSATCRSLLDAGAEVNASADSDDQDDEGQSIGETPLMLAAQEGHTETCRLLISAGAEVNAFTRTADTPLMMAAMNGHPATCALLLECGARVRDVDRWGNSALHYAIGNCINDVFDTPTCMALVTCLIKAGAPVNLPNNEDATPIDLAADLGDSDILQLLLDTQQAAASTPAE